MNSPTSQSDVSWAGETAEPEKPFYKFDEPGTLRKPCVIGRLVRLGLGVPLLWIAWRLFFDADLADLGHLPFWSLALLLIWLFPAVVNIGFGRAWGNWRPRVFIVGAAVLASIVSAVAFDGFLGPPLWWVMLPWMMYVAVHLGLSFVLASVLATPGCEMRAIPHLVGLISGRPRAEHYCPGFLDGLDRWEARSHGGAEARETESPVSTTSPRDIVSSGFRMLALFGIPIAAIVISGNLGSWNTVTVVWPVAFLMMGLVCVVNALRSGRVHCFFTGPLFLVVALVSLLHGLKVVSLGAGGWQGIVSVTFVAAAVLYYSTENVWGKYFGSGGSRR